MAVLGSNPAMAAQKKPLSEFERQFLARTAEARNAAGMTQIEIAQSMGIKQDKYKWYEKRTLLPHELVVQFCLLTRRTIHWLYTGFDPR